MKKSSEENINRILDLEMEFIDNTIISRRNFSRDDLVRYIKNRLNE